jgi:competence protein ComEC
VKIFFFLFFITPIDSIASRLVIWDVGQGSSHSIIEKNICIHFDLGGERSPIREILKHCRQKPNRVYVSHFDYDHINFIEDLMLRTKTCLVLPKNDPQHWFYKKHRKHSCPSSTSKSVIKIHEPEHNHSNRNHKSVIYAYKNKVLFTGDTTKEQEMIWTQKTKPPYDYILLGHHGSKTSNSSAFLKLFGPSSIAIVSARKAKYGHPHNEVNQRLKLKKIPKLLTEDWGSIHIILE